MGTKETYSVSNFSARNWKETQIVTGGGLDAHDMYRCAQAQSRSVNQTQESLRTSGGVNNIKSCRSSDYCNISSVDISRPGVQNAALTSSKSNPNVFQRPTGVNNPSKLNDNNLSSVTFTHLNGGMDRKNQNFNGRIPSLSTPTAPPSRPTQVPISILSDTTSRSHPNINLLSFAPTGFPSIDIDDHVIPNGINGLNGSRAIFQNLDCSEFPPFPDFPSFPDLFSHNLDIFRQMTNSWDYEIQSRLSHQSNLLSQFFNQRSSTASSATSIPDGNNNCNNSNYNSSIRCNLHRSNSAASKSTRKYCNTYDNNIQLDPEHRRNKSNTNNTPSSNNNKNSNNHGQYDIPNNQFSVPPSNSSSHHIPLSSWPRCLSESDFTNFSSVPSTPVQVHRQLQHDEQIRRNAVHRSPSLKSSSHSSPLSSSSSSAASTYRSSSSSSSGGGGRGGGYGREGGDGHLRKLSSLSSSTPSLYQGPTRTSTPPFPKGSEFETCDPGTQTRCVCIM